MNPKPYTTTYDGTNFRFNGVGRGFYGGADIRTVFRPNPDNQSLQDHSGFAWVKLDSSSTPNDGSGWVPNLKVFTVIGNIGGRANNGVFGVEENGTSLIYKMRCIKSAGGVTSPVLQSTLFADITSGWHLIAFSFDFAAQQACFYLDGVSLGCRTIADPIDSINGSTGAATIGYFSVTGNPNACGQFSGLMNIVGFYNKNLSASEQEALYNATKYRFV